MLFNSTQTVQPFNADYAAITTVRPFGLLRHVPERDPSRCSIHQATGARPRVQFSCMLSGSSAFFRSCYTLRSCHIMAGAWAIGPLFGAAMHNPSVAATRQRAGDKLQALVMRS